MKKFFAGMIFTVITEGIVAVAVLVNKVMEGADNE